jgi:hypothetical protein
MLLLANQITLIKSVKANIRTFSSQVKYGFLFRRGFVDQPVVLEDVHLAHGASPFLQKPLVDAALVELKMITSSIEADSTQYM